MPLLSFSTVQLSYMKILKIFLLSFLILFTSQAIAQSSWQLKKKKESIQKEIKLLQRNLNRASRNRRLTYSQLNALSAKIRLMQSKITVINSEIRNLDHQIHTNKRDVYSLQDRLATLKEDYADMIRFAQKNSNSYDKMMFIFSSENFNQAYKRLKYFQQFGDYRKKQMDYIAGTQKSLNYKIVVLDKDLKEKNNLLLEQEKERIQLDRNKSRQAVVLRRFSKQEKRYKQDLAARKRQQAQINRSYRNAIVRELAAERKRALAAARAKAAKAAQLDRIAAAKAKAANRPAPVAKAKSASAYMALTPSAKKLSAGFESNRGSLPWPVSRGTITETFGKHKSGQASYTNGGVTITTASGALVRAVFNGQVSKVGSLPGGYYVLIKHGQYFTVYQNLRSVSVARGTNVTTKQTIGVVATAGSIPELQFQIYRGAVAQNPAAWISR